MQASGGVGVSGNKVPNARAEHVSILRALERGSDLIKVKTPKKTYTRFFFIDDGGQHLCYDGSAKPFGSSIVNMKLSGIRDIRDGKKEFSKKVKGINKELLFCVVFGAKHRVLYLVAASVAEKEKWMKGLKFLVQADMFAAQQKEHDKWIQDAFGLADKNKDGGVDFRELLKLLKALNVDLDRDYVKKLFDNANTNKQSNRRGKQTLDRKEFVSFYKMITKRPEMEELFQRFSDNKAYMGVDELLLFLTEAQKVIHLEFGIEQYVGGRPADIEEKLFLLLTEVSSESLPHTKEARCHKIIQIYEPDPDFKQDIKLSLDGFRKFMLSDDQLLFNARHQKVYQDMQQPLSNYYINSSHNTYLMEDQLKGPSSTEAYIRALQAGCRCVELDCWNGPDGEPIVYHGHTLTSKIKFEDVINVIKAYAFEKSEYPVILSIENHCNIDQQKRMAMLMKKIFGDMLFTQPLDDEKLTLPSPQDLCEKIIVKAKKLPASITDDEDDVSDEDEAAEMDDADMAGEDRPKSNKLLKLAMDFSNIVIACRSVHFRGFKNAENNAHFADMSSLGETKTEKLIEKEGADFVQHCMRQMIRIYPSGSRTDSSNYNPVTMWNVGCQIVALNFQTPDEPMHVNHGKFLDNGQSGYVLKPEFLKEGTNLKFNPDGPYPKEWRRKVSIQVISGYQLPKPNNSTKGEIIDPYVKIQVFGVKMDQEEFQTSVIHNDGFNPLWNETFSFLLNVPDLAQFKFTVKDYDPYSSNDFIGFFSLPFTSMQEGYRQFPLCDKYSIKNQKAVIFVHVTISEVSDTGMTEFLHRFEDLACECCVSNGTTGDAHTCTRL